MTDSTTGRAGGGAGGRAIVNGIEIARAPADVFDYLTDVQREPEWNEQLLVVESLDGPPLRVGSRFRVRFGRGVGDAVIEYLTVERPHRWRTRSTSPRLHVAFTGEIAATAAGSSVRLRTVLLPQGPLRLAAPLLRAVMRRSWDEHLARVRAILEQPPPDQPPGQAKAGPT